jgi:hypothetical protein
MAKAATAGVVAAATILSVAGVYFVMNRNGQLPPVSAGVQAIKDLVAIPEPEKVPSDDTKAGTEEASRKATSSRAPATPPKPSVATEPAPPGPPAGDMPARAPEPPPEPPPVSANAAPRAAPARTSLFLPGNFSGWTAYDITVDAPILIRAAGHVSIGGDIAGPNGLRNSTYEQQLRRPNAASDDRVVPSAPYLALVGRICSGLTCSDPFLVGASSVLCPSELNMRGQLQLWTNNYVRVNGSQTVMRYSQALGGYSFYAEAAPEGACGGTPGAASYDERALTEGQVLRNPEFRVSSRQTSWKPFFLPLGTPLRIEATGDMQPRGGAPATGPGGIDVPTATTWVYPGTRTVVVDGEHRLFDPTLPYQALIGRLCSAASCGAPFLVGRDRIVCATLPFNDHLELWINHIISPRGLLGNATPLTMDAFELQVRRGEYRFEVTRAPPGSCGG